jgi:ABC-type Fe3+/spermidine/putrescine transport system ATPase subunit
LSGSALRVEGLSASWGKVPVLERVSLTVDPGETVVLLGPNGSGKSTLLRCIAGLETPSAGRIWLGERELTSLPSYRRGVGMVSQEPSLFLHRTVAENIAYGPEVQGASREETDARIRALSERLGLGQLLARRPGELSGGEQARVSLARALAASPGALLLDEPFASIDPPFRSALRAEFRSILHNAELPVVHVTHDREEGLYLADRLLLLFHGRVHAEGRPEELFRHPPTVRAAKFLGYNVLDVGGRFEAILPQELRVVPAGAGRAAGTVVAAGSFGPESGVHVRLSGGEMIEVRFPSSTPSGTVGQRVGLEWSHSVVVAQEPEREDEA